MNLYGDYEKMGLISEIMFRISMTISPQNGITSLTKFKHSVLLRKRISHYGFGFLILSIPSSIGSILFLLESTLSIKSYALVNTRFHFVRFPFSFSSQPP